MPVSDWNFLMNVSRNGAIALSWKEPMVIEPLAFFAPAPPPPLPDDDEPPQAASHSPVAPSAPRRMAWRRVNLLLLMPSPLLLPWPAPWSAPAPRPTRGRTRGPAAVGAAARTPRRPAARTPRPRGR